MHQPKQVSVVCLREVYKNANCVEEEQIFLSDKKTHIVGSRPVDDVKINSRFINEEHAEIYRDNKDQEWKIRDPNTMTGTRTNCIYVPFTAYVPDTQTTAATKCLAFSRC